MALNGTMVKIETVTVGSGGATSIAFTNIPQTYTDLYVVLSLRSSASGGAYDPILYRFNQSTTGYSARSLYGNGASAGSGTPTTATSTAASGTWGRLNDAGIPTASQTASTFGSTSFYVPNYTSSNNKSVSSETVEENNATTSWMEIDAALWSDVSAITRVDFALKDGSFVQHSTATLYGISRTTSQIKATGGTVYDDASYVYHLFNASGTFTPSSNLTCDVLVVAGGGGGGRSFGGGGGAGGLLSFTSQSLTAQNYTVTVGAGAASQGGSAFAGNNGSDSQFGSLTLVKGGGGGGYDAGGGVGSNGKAGGSGGGGSRVGFGTGGSPETGQGFRGGNQTGTGGTGGGGAGGTGQDLNGSNGTGGVGSSAFSSWGAATSSGQNVGGTYYYAGGGGGQSGAGGYGGGGTNINGGTSTNANGTANTGGGGGGDTTVSNGGSGIVIVRYAK